MCTFQWKCKNVQGHSCSKALLIFEAGLNQQTRMAKPRAWLQIHFGCRCDADRRLKNPKHSSIYYHICGVVKDTEDTTTVVGVWFHSTICLETTKHHNAATVQTHTNIHTVSSEFNTQHCRINSHIMGRQKNHPHHFSPSLDRNSSATEIRTQKWSRINCFISFQFCLSLGGRELGVWICSSH